MIPIVVITEKGNWFNYHTQSIELMAEINNRFYLMSDGGGLFPKTQKERDDEDAFDKKQMIKRRKVVELLHKVVANCFLLEERVSNKDAYGRTHFIKCYRKEQTQSQIYLKDIIEKVEIDLKEAQNETN